MELLKYSLQKQLETTCVHEINLSTERVALVSANRRLYKFQVCIRICIDIVFGLARGDPHMKYALQVVQCETKKAVNMFNKFKREINHFGDVDKVQTLLNVHVSDMHMISRENKEQLAKSTCTMHDMMWDINIIRRRVMNRIPQLKNALNITNTHKNALESTLYNMDSP
tara:strand:+ start:400 stop:906 length:507 start_codon:yes stop_codon:yes gene_type:complete